MSKRNKQNEQIRRARNRRGEPMSTVVVEASNAIGQRHPIRTTPRQREIVSGVLALVRHT